MPSSATCYPSTTTLSDTSSRGESTETRSSTKLRRYALFPVFFCSAPSRLVAKSLPYFSSSLSCISQIGGHMVGTPCPFRPTNGAGLQFCRAGRAWHSLPSTTRAPNCGILELCKKREQFMMSFYAEEIARNYPGIPVGGRWGVSYSRGVTRLAIVTTCRG